MNSEKLLTKSSLFSCSSFFDFLLLNSVRMILAMSGAENRRSERKRDHGGNRKKVTGKGMRKQSMK